MSNDYHTKMRPGVVRVVVPFNDLLQIMGVPAGGKIIVMDADAVRQCYNIYIHHPLLSEQYLTNECVGMCLSDFLLQLEQLQEKSRKTITIENSGSTNCPSSVCPKAVLHLERTSSQFPPTRRDRELFSSEVIETCQCSDDPTSHDDFVDRLIEQEKHW